MKKLKIVSPSAELSVIKAMCNRDPKISGRVLATVDESYFYETVSLELYQIIKSKFSESALVPTLRQLSVDPEVSDEAKEFIKTGAAVEAPATVEQADSALKLLNKYRRTRILYNMVQDVAQAFEASKLDIDKLVLNCASNLQKAQSTKSTTECFTHFGSGDNAKDLLNDIVFGEEKGDIIPTGFKTFDDQSGGFNRGALVTLGATSGSGKSLLAAQLSINLAEAGYKVVLVPLEMSKREMGNRLLANIGNMDLSSIRQHKLDERDKNLLSKRQRRWRKKVHDAGGRLTIFRPEEDLDIDEVYAAIAALQCDVCIIDYISLLKGIDDENQWLRLGTIARKAKVNAEITNRVNILLCQVNDEGKIRYSGAVKEHCINGNSLLLTNKGLLPVKELFPNVIIAGSTRLVSGIQVKTDMGYRDITHVHYNGVRLCYNVELENGMMLSCTASHKFRLLRKESLTYAWTPLFNLKVGDYVAIDSQASDLCTCSFIRCSGNRFVKIRAIVADREYPVYDITVAIDHCYVVNGILTHNSETSWIWTPSDEDKKAGIVKIEQIKSRNAEPFPFSLKFVWNRMRVESVDEDIDSAGLPDVTDEDQVNLAADI